MIDNEITSQTLEGIREEAARDIEEVVRRIEVVHWGLLQATHTVRVGL